jgi:hypothetical protein
VKAEITADAPGELVITLAADELPVPASDAALKAGLPQNAAAIADAILAMIGQAPEPGEAKAVHAVHVRLVRVQVIAETSMLLDAEREVWT